jgi:hypothetical protein
MILTGSKSIRNVILSPHTAIETISRSSVANLDNGDGLFRPQGMLA